MSHNLCNQCLIIVLLGCFKILFIIKSAVMNIFTAKCLSTLGFDYFPRINPLLHLLSCKCIFSTLFALAF